ncbi:MAG: heavy metal-binding domain-containing protein [Saprospiraceae bacterium]
MKKYIYIILLMTCILGFQCKEKIKPNEKGRPMMEKVDESGTEFTSQYVCPMHCKGSGSDHPGKCPVCEMDYELNESFKKDSIH